jgi:hypothetical protein
MKRRRAKTKRLPRSYKADAEKLRRLVDQIEAYGDQRTTDVLKLTGAILALSNEAQQLEKRHLKATELPDPEFSLDGPSVELPDVEFSLDGPSVGATEPIDDEE